MNEENTCLDYYGKKLKIGDEVLQVEIKDGLKGTINGIRNIGNNSYIDIWNRRTRRTYSNLDSSTFSTLENIEEIGRRNTIYYLIFYDEKFTEVAIKPLTSDTNPNYQMPSNTCYVALDAVHLDNEEKDELVFFDGPQYSNHEIYYFIDINKARINYDKKMGYCYITTDNNFGSVVINDNYKLFDQSEKLNSFIKNLISYFNKSDLTDVDNKTEFDKNEKAKIFERKLIQDIYRQRINN